jgi:hypothetical protein
LCTVLHSELDAIHGEAFLPKHLLFIACFGEESLELAGTIHLKWARLLDLFAQKLRCSSLTYFGPNTLATRASFCAKICCATAFHSTESFRLSAIWSK